MAFVGDPIGLQQARLLYSDAHLSPQQEYQIQRNYPRECHQVFVDLARRDGWIVEKTTAKKVMLFINEHFSERCARNPIPTVTLSFFVIGLITNWAIASAIVVLVGTISFLVLKI